MDVDENDDQIKGENDEMMAMTAMTTKETRHIPHLIPLYGCPVLNEGGKEPRRRLSWRRYEKKKSTDSLSMGERKRDKNRDRLFVLRWS